MSLTIPRALSTYPDRCLFGSNSVVQWAMVPAWLCPGAAVRFPADESRHLIRYLDLNDESASIKTFDKNFVFSSDYSE